jgi:carbonic anhydrase
MGDDNKVPRAATAIVTCMDVRIDPLAALGYAPGDAHVLRNAGAVATDDVVRSLIASQRLLGTKRVEVLAHTDCGMATASARALGDELGRDLLCFDDLDASVRATVERLRSERDLVHDDVRGYVLDVATGTVRPVDG